MRNVIINKICQFVVTENQLRAFWKKLGEDLEFESLTNEQLMSLAKRELDQASYKDLEAHIVGHGWRTEDELKGKMIAEDDSDPTYHIEVIDTSIPQRPSRIVIDRMIRLECKDCGFSMFVQNVDVDPSTLKCPSDGGEMEIKPNGTNVKHLNRSQD